MRTRRNTTGTAFHLFFRTTEKALRYHDEKKRDSQKKTTSVACLLYPNKEARGLWTSRASLNAATMVGLESTNLPEREQKIETQNETDDENTRKQTLSWADTIISQRIGKERGTVATVMVSCTTDARGKCIY